MSAEVAKKAVDLGLLEEDDAFEEFPTLGKIYFSSFQRYAPHIMLKKDLFYIEKKCAKKTASHFNLFV